MPEGIPNQLEFPQTNNFFPGIDAFKGVSKGHALSRELVAQNIVYRGITESAAATEIFIDNDPQYRLTIPNNSVIQAEWRGIAWNIDAANNVDGTVALSSGAFNVRRYGNNGELNAFNPTTPGVGFVFNYNSTFQAITCTVTPGTTDTVLWLVRLSALAVGRFAAATNYGRDYTGIPR